MPLTYFKCADTLLAYCNKSIPANQKLLCLQRKCGLGVEKALSVDALRGSAPCRWAFPGVLFIIKKCWNEIFGNFEK